MAAENHTAPVVQINEITKHPNADSLEIIHIDGYQCITKIGQFKIGDLAVYIQPDSVVPEIAAFAFIWEGIESPVPAKKRRITVRKFRGEYSEGLLIPIADLGLDSQNPATGFGAWSPIVGMDLSKMLGITHYEPEERNTAGDHEAAPRSKKRLPRTLKGWFYFLLRLVSFGRYNPHPLQNEEVAAKFRPDYDIKAWQNFKGKITEDELVIATEKIHGSNARFTYQDGKQYAGSHYYWKAATSNCIFRRVLKAQPWIGQWCETHPGYTLYGEVIPTQKEPFSYGSTAEEPRFFVFDVLDPHGNWIDYITAGDMDGGDPTLHNNWAPLIFQGPMGQLLARRGEIVDGPSEIVLYGGKPCIREGVVIRTLKEQRIPGLGRAVVKIKSNAFLEKDSK